MRKCALAPPIGRCPFHWGSRSKGVGAAENQFSRGEGMQGGVTATNRPQQGDVDTGSRTRRHRWQREGGPSTYIYIYMDC